MGRDLSSVRRELALWFVRPCCEQVIQFGLFPDARQLRLAIPRPLLPRRLAVILPLLSSCTISFPRHPISNSPPLKGER